MRFVELTAVISKDEEALVTEQIWLNPEHVMEVQLARSSALMHYGVHSEVWMAGGENMHWIMQQPEDVVAALLGE